MKGNVQRKNGWMGRQREKDDNMKERNGKKKKIFFKEDLNYPTLRWKSRPWSTTQYDYSIHIPCERIKTTNKIISQKINK